MRSSSVTRACVGVLRRSKLFLNSELDIVSFDELVQDREGEVQGGPRDSVVSSALLRPHQHDAGPVWKSILEKM